MRASCPSGMSPWWCPPATEAFAMTTEDQKKGNLRMALILASIALAFFVGFMVKMFLLSN
jgi:hypothetical protein